MDEKNGYPQVRTVGHWDDGGEARGVEESVWPHRIQVVEWSRGDLTQEVYGVPIHRHGVTVDHSEALAVAADQDLDHLPEWVAAMLADPSRQLSDLMDFMDRALVPYGYWADNGSGLESFRPKKDGAPWGTPSKSRWCGVQDSNL